MSPSDPFDDEEDDFFANPETVDILNAVEQRAIHQASQAPPSKTRSSQPYHHTLAKPRNSPKVLPTGGGRGGKQPIKEPRPLNTEPRAGGSGFGWEHGGKRSMDGAIERHIEAVKKKELYWASNAGRREYEDEESPPVDVVMDASGKFELGGAGDEGVVITDNRRAQQNALGESLAAASSQSAIPLEKRKQSEDAVAARRRAIAEATAAGSRVGNGNGGLPPRPPLSRSNSASSGFAAPSPQAGPSRQFVPPSMNNANTDSQKFSSNRSLSRSISAGVQVFNHRPNAAAGPSRLPTIPSQSEGFSNGHDGPPPASQGSAARQAAIELERERQRRQELEAELTKLRLQAEKGQDRVQVENERPVNGAGEGGEGKIKELQAQVWAAKGEAETMRRAQREEHARHLAEIERLRAALADKDVQIKEKENQQKRAVESIKHQAVFSNHAVQNSAMKVRPPQSQRMPSASQSQFRAMPTPVRNGSPSRRGSFFDAEATPLIRSVKGKGKAAPLPPPPFGKFNNAFAATPLAANRSKRQKTEDFSPRASPVKGQTRPPSSPLQASPVRIRNGGSSPAPMDEDEEEGIDWGQGGAMLDIHHDVDMGDGTGEILPTDQRAELLYHLLNHVSLSSFQTILGLTTQPTIYRILNYSPPSHTDQRQAYTERCSELLRACGDADLAFEQLIEIVGRTLSAMLEIVARTLLDVKQIELSNVAAICNVISLIASTAFLFPALVPTIATYGISSTCRDIVNSTFSETTSLARVPIKFDESVMDADGEVELGDGLAEAVKGWHLELADVLVNLCETMCWFGEGVEVWHGDELVDIILGLTETHLDKMVVRRGVELFYSASCLSSNFRALTALSETYKQQSLSDQSPSIERVSRYLFTSHPACTEQESLKMSLLIVRGLCMLSISHEDAVILMGQRSILVPALILVLQRESTKIWGIHADYHSPEDALSLLQPSLSLLHHLVFPSPLSSTLSRSSQTEQELPTGIDLPERLHSASASKEFNGLQHVFVSAMGCMAYGLVDEGMISESDQRSVQVLSGDLLENVVEGPEGDNIYEMYVAVDEEEGGDGVGVDMDAYAEMEVEED
ncbi:hypothetical protein CI109_102115 [Kwoniella shandongensis]|uniref:Uncharacterized protein n=1 Tax=Kwoniella shandongensis TaxID=1734106 RepID=A0AAJ8LH17_9TREE